MTPRISYLFLSIIFIFLFLPGFKSSDATESNAADRFTIARVKYGGGGDWYSNPTSLPNLLTFVREQTGVSTVSQEEVVDLSSPRLFSFPYLYLNGHGNISFTEREVQQLRLYLESGGFLHADDNYGMDKSFRREMKRVLPESEFFELPFKHPIYHSHFDFSSGPPKIHEHDNKPAQGLGLFLDGKLVVFYTYQSDLGDGWEDPDVHNDPEEKRMAALKMGANIIIWRLRGGQ
ncbi:MAG: DUF4159 domain-containing protein [Calditrichaeota bacterium]|nr:DUF4159 domain-containing protein [Calditrichota bacterium]